MQNPFFIFAFCYHCYRPQTKFAKVMFSQVLSIHGGSLSRRVSVQEGLCPGGSLSRETPRTVKSDRYVSCWNAFLIFIIFENVNADVDE